MSKLELLFLDVTFNVWPANQILLTIQSLGYCFPPHGHAEAKDAYLKLKSIK